MEDKFEKKLRELVPYIIVIAVLFLLLPSLLLLQISAIWTAICSSATTFSPVWRSLTDTSFFLTTLELESSPLAKDLAKISASQSIFGPID